VNEQADAVVIGAGCLGISIALELSRMGYSTLSVDRLGAVGHGSTSQSASIVRVYSSTSEMAALAWETIPLWHAWSQYIAVPDETGFAEYRRTGSLVIESPKTNLEHLESALVGLGVEHEVWTLDDMTANLPHFDLRSFWPPRGVDDERFFDEPTAQLNRALYVPEGGYVVDASLATQNLATACRAAGGRFRLRAEVATIRQRAGAVTGVNLADGTSIDTPVVVNAAGPHSSVINTIAGVTAGMNVRTRPLRRELHILPAPRGIPGGDFGLCVSDGDLAINFRPEPGDQILVGTEDPDCDPLEWVGDPDHYNTLATVAQWDRQVLRLARRIPALKVPPRPRGIAGLYDASDDWMPIYDRSDLGGFYMAVGSSGTQFKVAPTVGYLMARLIDACQSGHDHDLRPISVRLPNRGIDVDLRAFSRLRHPRRDSAFI
jgi:sarcosine oxidase, subunit beta